ncbi:short-chain dehydrogenase/reductase [Rhizocola hellebori]|uniref:Short-chain dehydrogenase/reductase n=1 Tax=Rhizocola hellebori TaxID=1392758 RepID=A0A8J3VGH2_9ACTN|nr:SDR family NAD(P)-dependent oxidoreductase [Rhizocola hellebori]GIH05142.1 short-chain dehydrogenase/reductase [Rhizocola hellebori]
MSVWFVTGTSRGFGLEITRQLLARGETVVATARDTSQLKAQLNIDSERLLLAELDVTRPEQAQRAVETALATFGRIDVLVNNAGRGLLGAVEEANDTEIRGIYETNVFGLLTVTRAVLPVMRKQGSGRIVNLSSVLGFSAKMGWGIYASTKFAVEGLSEALQLELEPLGISVMIVEPGLFRTDFLDPTSLHWAQKTIDDYGQTAGRIRQWAVGHNHEQKGDPVKAATAIIDAAILDQPPTRLALGVDCVERIDGKLADTKAEMDLWRTVGMSMSYDSLPV